MKSARSSTLPSITTTQHELTTWEPAAKDSCSYFLAAPSRSPSLSISYLRAFQTRSQIQKLLLRLCSNFKVKRCGQMPHKQTVKTSVQAPYLFLKLIDMPEWPLKKSYVETGRNCLIMRKNCIPFPVLVSSKHDTLVSAADEVAPKFKLL